MAHDMQAGGYQRDLMDQPKAVRDTVQGLRKQALPEAVAARLARGDFRRVVLTGMGSSFFAFHPLHQALVWRGVDAHMVETSELLHGLHGLLRPDTLVIAASQSGQSAEAVALVEQKAQIEQKAQAGNRGAQFALLAVSNTPGSPLAEGSDGCIFTRAGTEFSVSCKTYLTMLVALAWLEPLLFGEPTAAVLNDLENAAAPLERYLAGWQAHVADLKVRLKDVRDLFILGRGASLAAANNGGLTIKESTHMHSEGMSSPAFRHGPLEMVDAQTFVLVFAGQGPALALNRRLYQDVLALGGPAGLVIENAPEPVFRLAPGPERLKPLLEMLPVQMMTLALADLHGHVAGQFRHVSKVTATE